MIEYFAYGSNINLRHLRSCLSRFGLEPEGAMNPRRGVVRDYRLRTNYLSCVHNAGAANIEPSPGDAVEGVVMKITPECWAALMLKEGCPSRYIDASVDVYVPRTRATVSAVTFVVNPDCRLDYEVPVTQKYRDLILAGAQDAGLSRDYQKQLRRILKPAPETSMPSTGDTAMGTRRLGRSPGNPSKL